MRITSGLRIAKYGSASRCSARVPRGRSQRGFRYGLAGWGALFGLFTYATYDLTNLATLRDWPLRVVVVDVLWGVVLRTVVASAGFFIGRWLRGGG
jgi:uncharacterized membrane protein